MNVTSIQGNSFTQGYLNHNFKEQESFNNDIKIEEDKKTIEEDKKIIDHRNLSNEETKNLYLAYQMNNLMKTKIDIYLSIEDNDLEYKDIRELNKSENRIDAMLYYNEQSNVVQNNSKHEIWA